MSLVFGVAAGYHTAHDASIVASDIHTATSLVIVADVSVDPEAVRTLLASLVSYTDYSDRIWASGINVISSGLVPAIVPSRASKNAFIV